MPSIPFTVDAALLQELGERLVGRPHIALAELIKNSYDADATVVEVTVAADRIEVTDDGHGMDFAAFRDYWMRIGTPHKDREAVSPHGRRFTGSKGVGRLSAQFLADELELTTRAVPEDSPVRARVDWRAAVKAKALTSATATYSRLKTASFAEGSPVGTRIVLRNLKQDWTPHALENLARELWPLQPPYASADDQAFRVALTAEKDPEAQRRFDHQMRAILGLWTAKIRGRTERHGKALKLTVTIEFPDDSIYEETTRLEPCRVGELTYEIRVFDLDRRQPHGIKVGQAREYLNEFGGVHIYDAGFHLPYYGPTNDWLGIEFDHAHRLSRSGLLPAHLQVKRGMNFLPTNSRLYGTVQANTSTERRTAATRGQRPAEALGIQVSRDRLIDNDAFVQVQKAVRWGVDLYAMTQASRVFAAQDSEPTMGASLGIERVEDVLEAHRSEIAPDVFEQLRTGLDAAVEAVESEAQQVARYAGLLGALATAGISAVAAEHEQGRQLAALRQLSARVKNRAAQGDDAELHAMAVELEEWIARLATTRALFQPLLDQESREGVEQYLAAQLIRETVKQSSLLLRGVDVHIQEIPPRLQLPLGRYVEWSSLIQNVIVNAANAALEDDDPRVVISTGLFYGRRRLWIQNNGLRVDVDTSDRLFEPFQRHQGIDAGRAALGAGGTGLGLTIVRMIANNLGVKVEFVEPDEGWETCFEIGWRTK